MNLGTSGREAQRMAVVISAMLQAVTLAGIAQISGECMRSERTSTSHAGGVGKSGRCP